MTRGEKIAAVVVVAIVLAKRASNRIVSPAKAIPKPAPPPKVYAYLYQLPDDGFTTTRMAFSTAGSGKPPEFMGLFGSPRAAMNVAKQKGWELAWDGVRQLSQDPSVPPPRQ